MAAKGTTGPGASAARTERPAPGRAGGRAWGTNESGSSRAVLAVVAGEDSGDILGAGLLRGLKERLPGVRFEGIAGPRMQAEGCRSLYPMERLSVMGLVEAAARYVSVLPMRAALARRFLAQPPAAFIGIDAPDFNLGLEARLHAAGIPTVHYVSPSVWAWRRYRVRRIARSVDLMLALFPFEAEFYEARGVPVSYVGHPLADEIPEPADASAQLAARRALGLAEDGPVVALLPGSRVSEIDRLSRPMLAAAAWIQGRRERIRFVLPIANPAVAVRFERAAGAALRALPLTVVQGRSREAMTAADVVLLASGTATLEALLLGRPMVITYRLSPLTYRVMKAMFHVSHVGLPNLLAGRGLVPELLQDAARPERMGAEVLRLLDATDARAELIAEFGRIQRALRRGADACAAQAVAGMLGG